MDQREVLQRLAKEKLNAFTLGNMRKRVTSKQKLKEQKQKKDDEAIGHVFQEFFTTFQDPTLNSSKVWIKGGTYDPELKKEDVAQDVGRIYKPMARLKSSAGDALERAKECAKIINHDLKFDVLKRKDQGKKSNLELLKEEMKQIQEEREERHKIKTVVTKISESDFQLMVKNEMGCFDVCDPTTTNLYLGNLNPNLPEIQLMEIFGKFGPLASVKIMWPRTEEEKLREHNCGFVAYMNRMDAERAMRNLNGKIIMGYELRISWGKCVPIPNYPVYIPQAIQKLSLPPPFSGLPFNAQPLSSECNGDRSSFNGPLSETVIKVVIPTDRKILCLIHRMIEFVIREGPLFEAIIMKREINNPLFRFLFDNRCHEHIYYRWKLFSIMQGDSRKEWRTEAFRMFDGGSVWLPPPVNLYTRGMPENLIDSCYKDPSKSLSSAQKERFQQLLDSLTPERLRIGETMIFAMQHGKAADDICNLILGHCKNSTNLCTTLSCLYLISDILSNSSRKIHDIAQYRRAIDTRLMELFNHAYNVFKKELCTLKQFSFHLRLDHLFDYWKMNSFYPDEMISKLRNDFEKVLSPKKIELEVASESSNCSTDEDGEPIELKTISSQLCKGSNVVIPPKVIYPPSKWD